MHVFDLWAVVRVGVCTPKAEAADLAHFGFCTAALAFWSVAPFVDERRLTGHRSRNAPCSFVLVVGTGSEFHRAIAVVVPLHEKSADAGAFGIVAFPTVPSIIAEVAVGHGFYKE